MAEVPYSKLAAQLMVKQYAHTDQVMNLDCFSLRIG